MSETTMNEMSVLQSMRAEVTEPELAGAQARLDAVLHKGIVRPRPYVRVGFATALAAAVALAALVLLPHGRAPSAGQTATDSPSLRLAAAAAATSRTSYRFSASLTSSTDNNRMEQHGVWDPASHQGQMVFLDNGLPGGVRHPLRESAEFRQIGPDLWMTYPDRPGKVDHVILVPQVMAQSMVHGIALPLTNGSLQTIDPHAWVKALLADGGTIKDLGVSGHGAKAVHRYRFVEKRRPCGAHVPPPCSVGTATVETGTVSVGVRSGMIARVTWTQQGEVPEEPFQPSTFTSTVEYSDYGLPVHITRP